MFQGVQQLMCMKQVSKIGLSKLNELTKGRTWSIVTSSFWVQSQVFFYIPSRSNGARGFSLCWGTNGAKEKQNFRKCWMQEVREIRQGWEMAGQAKSLLRKAELVIQGEALETARREHTRTIEDWPKPIAIQKDVTLAAIKQGRKNFAEEIHG